MRDTHLEVTSKEIDKGIIEGGNGLGTESQETKEQEKNGVFCYGN